MFQKSLKDLENGKKGDVFCATKPYPLCTTFVRRAWSGYHTGPRRFQRPPGLKQVNFVMDTEAFAILERFIPASGRGGCCSRASSMNTSPDWKNGTRANCWRSCSQKRQRPITLLPELMIGRVRVLTFAASGYVKSCTMVAHLQTLVYRVRLLVIRAVQGKPFLCAAFFMCGSGSAPDQVVVPGERAMPTGREVLRASQGTGLVRSEDQAPSRKACSWRMIPAQDSTAQALTQMPLSRENPGHGKAGATNATSQERMTV